MGMRDVATWLLVSVFALAACGKQAEEAPAPEPAPVAPATAPAAATPDPATEPTAEEIPVAEDFEAEVTAEINPDNYMAELDAIEKELDSK